MPTILIYWSEGRSQEQKTGVIDGIIEWVGTRRSKIPHLLRHPDGAPFAMAGLWNRWYDRQTKEEIWSCTVIVKDADDWYARFHDRMAVLLDPSE